MVLKRGSWIVDYLNSFEKETMWLKTSPGSAVYLFSKQARWGVQRQLDLTISSGMFRLKKLRGQESLSFCVQIHEILRKIL